MTQTLNLHQRLAAVMRDVSYVQKGDRRVNGQYNYVSHDAVVAKLRPALVQHGVLCIVSVTGHSQDSNRTEADVQLTFANVDAPDQQIVVNAFGYGVDPQDKGPGKAVSYAVKYALLKALMLETGDDPDRDDVDYSPAPTAPKPKPAPKPEPQPQPPPQPKPTPAPELDSKRDAMPQPDKAALKQRVIDMASTMGVLKLVPAYLERRFAQKTFDALTDAQAQDATTDLVAKYASWQLLYMSAMGQTEDANEARQIVADIVAQNCEGNPLIAPVSEWERWVEWSKQEAAQ